MLYLLFFSVTAWAGGIFCQNDPRDIQAQLSWNDLSVSLRITSPMGYDYLPQLDAPVSASSAKFLKMQAEDLQALGDSFVIRWDRKACEIPEQPWLMHCGPGKIDNNEIKSIGLSGILETQEQHFGMQRTWKLRLVLSHGNTYFMTIPFSRDFCKAQ